MPHILIMDDEPEFAFELRHWLEDQGHDVTWTRTASEARQAIGQGDVELIITDIYVYNDGMPVPDGGISLIGELRIRRVEQTARSLHKLPVIAMSAAVNNAGNEHVLETAKNLGALWVLSKPLNYKELAECVTDVFAKQKA